MVSKHRDSVYAVAGRTAGSRSRADNIQRFLMNDLEAALFVAAVTAMVLLAQLAG